MTQPQLASSPTMMATIPAMKRMAMMTQAMSASMDRIVP